MGGYKGVSVRAAFCIVGSVIIEITPGKYDLFCQVGLGRPALVMLMTVGVGCAVFCDTTIRLRFTMCHPSSGDTLVCMGMAEQSEAASVSGLVCHHETSARSVSLC